MLSDLLAQLVDICDTLRTRYPCTPEQRFERRVRSVYGTLGIERLDLTIEQVREALAKQPSGNSG